MRWCPLLALLLAASSDTSAQTTPLPDPAREVITRSQIEAAGLYRLTDLFRLIGSVRQSSVDGFTWRASLLDGDPFGSDTWTLMLDGQRVDSDGFGELNLALLPVAIPHVDSVEVWTAPRLVSGRIAAGGVIHIHTAMREDVGSQVRAGARIGLQNGDPGPFRYVPELASRNVDKFGADYEGFASTARQGWRASARAKLVRFYPTGEAAFYRNTEILNGADMPRARLFSGAARIEVDAAGGTHQLLLAGGGMNDFWFFSPYGRELPIQRWFGQVSARGGFPLRGGERADALHVSYRLSFGRSSLSQRFPEALGPDPDWRGGTVSAGVQLDWLAGAHYFGIGAEAESHTAEEMDGWVVTRSHASIRRTRRSGSEELVATLAAAEGQAAMGGAVISVQHVGPGVISTTVAYSQHLPGETRRLSFWTNRGYTAFDDHVTIESGPPASRSIVHLGSDVALPLGTAIRFRGGAAVRSFPQLTLESQPEAPHPDQLSAERLTRVEPGSGGTIGTAHAGVTWTRGIWSGGSSVNLQQPLGGADAFQRTWRSVSRYRASVNADITPSPSFMTSARMSFVSSSTWDGFEHIGSGPRGAYDFEVSALWLLDLAIRKTFWRDRVRASLTFQNLLGQDERYHPVGSSLTRRMYLRVELDLG